MDVMETNSGLQVPEEALDARAFPCKVGDIFRFHHLRKKDGSDCSDNKDAAGIIRKQVGGWYWFCHRCKEWGWKPDTHTSPEDTVKEIKHRRKLITGNKQPTHFLALPFDVRFIVGNGFVPRHVRKWLYKLGLDDHCLFQHEIGWSAMFKRVIFPIYDYQLVYNKTKERVFVGWAGRCTENYTKEERVEKKRPKWLMRKDRNLDRIFFVAPPSVGASSITVVVEDIPSAMKVNMATAFRTVALLNTEITSDLFKYIPEGDGILFWLDDDAYAKSMAAVRKYNSMGFNTTSLRSNEDPKNVSFIKIHKDLQNVKEVLHVT